MNKKENAINDKAAAKKIFLVFKTHLDLGYTALAEEIITRYREKLIPTSLDVAEELRKRCGAERFSWTMGSWIINDCLTNGPAALRARMEEGIRAGDLHWLGVPFTTHTELMDESLFQFGLSISQGLDARFGRSTIAAKMTDVPGHTRSMLPHLAQAGIRFLHIGCNPGSMNPDVPDIFRWRSPDGSEILVMYHKKEYGEITVPPGLDFGIAFAHTSDNVGPQNAEAIVAIYDKLRAQFPDAVIEAGSLNAFAEALLPYAERFPLITQELGDTWIHGPGSAPRRLAQYRALSRLRKQWVAADRFDDERPDHYAFSNNLLCVAEHTWGLGRGQLQEDSCYSKRDLVRLRQTPKCRRMERSWQEQDEYIDKAVAALDDETMQQEARAALQAIVPQRPDKSGYTALAAGQVTETDAWRIRFDSATGAIDRFLHKGTGIEWCRNGHQLGRFQYEVFSQQTCEDYLEDYMKNWPRVAWLAPLCNVRPDFDAQGLIKDQKWHAQETTVHHREEDGTHAFLVEMRMPAVPTDEFGCPRTVTIEWRISADGTELDCVVQCFDRDACRLPDAMWFTISPKAVVNDGWRLDKMGQAVSPFEVILHGNRRLHAIRDTVVYTGPEGRCEITPLDSPLVAPGKPELYDFSCKQPQVHHGMAFNLWNNMWNTNFTLWSEEDLRFRYKIRLESDARTALPDFDDWDRDQG